MKTEIAITRQEKYEIESIVESLHEIIEHTGFPDVEDKVVLLKPNILSDAAPEKAITTNPMVVEAIIRLLIERKPSSILLGDSPGLHTPGFCGRVSGFESIAGRYPLVKWVDFTRETRVHKLAGRISVPMTTAIDKADVVISIAKMKTHQLMFMTGCVKNMFGLVPGLNKSPMHLKAPSREQFAKVITAIYRESHVDYAFLDGIISMEGAGPANGLPRKTNLLMGSADAFGIDHAASMIMGYDPFSIPIYKEGLRQKLTDPDSYSYPILSPRNLVIEDFKLVEQKKSHLFNDLILPILMRPFRMRTIQKRPAPDFMENCIRCKRCVSICPASALKLENGRIVIDRKLCIRCYCCHEMCPVDAIRIDEQS